MKAAIQLFENILKEEDLQYFSTINIDKTQITLTGRNSEGARRKATLLGCENFLKVGNTLVSEKPGKVNIKIELLN